MTFFRRKKYPILPKKHVPITVKVTVFFIVLLIVVSLSLVAYYNRVVALKDNEMVELRVENSKLWRALRELNSSLTTVVEMLTRICCLPEALKYTLSKGEILTIGRLVMELSVDPNDPYRAIEEMYAWVVDNVKNISDPEIPAPAFNRPVCTEIGDEKFCYYEITSVRNYVQTPWFTAKYRQGDCEDQAVLMYAMLEFYFRYVRKEASKILLAIIDLGSGEKHAAVILPARNGGAIIIDPAGRYLTRNSQGNVFYADIYEEFLKYSGHWFSEGGVKRIYLYEIDVERETYYKVAEGDMLAVSSYVVSMSTSS